MKKTVLKFLLLSALLAASSGCSLLISNVKPVAEKSDDYGIMDISKVHPHWVRLDASQTADEKRPGDTPSSEIPDVAFQSNKTASIISLNSACRPSIETDEHDLHAFTELLFLGISNIMQRTEQTVQIQGVPALVTTLDGTLNNEHMKLKTVVVRKVSCIYDLMFVARPAHFDDDEAEFNQFAASLRLK